MASLAASRARTTAAWTSSGEGSAAHAYPSRPSRISRTPTPARGGEGEALHLAAAGLDLGPDRALRVGLHGLLRQRGLDGGGRERLELLELAGLRHRCPPR
ncbi:MAG: hypothetical protein KatS3mg014_2014 [Actinomycetota bacterium]|nr:MAG: hypothetical protein KatS3mg014_2014 [Actinomycetota bacterium]